MREVNDPIVVHPNPDQVEAIRMIAKGLDALARVNAEMAMEFREAIKAMPNPVDLNPVLEAIKKSSEKPTAYVFNIKRDGAGRMQKVEAFPK